jgi:20S proteasome subunit alpha 6
MKMDTKAMKTSSANRLSISYAAVSRWLVVDAGVVEKLRVFPVDGRFGAVINIEQ